MSRSLGNKNKRTPQTVRNSTLIKKNNGGQEKKHKTVITQASHVLTDRTTNWAVSRILRIAHEK